MTGKEVHFIQSFRFKIILYTFLSLLYTALTEILLYYILKAIHLFVKFAGPMSGVTEKAFNNPMSSSELKNAAINGYIDPAFERTASHFRGPVVFFMILIGIVLFVIYFLLLTKKFSNYLIHIVRGINRMATGDFTTRIRIEGKDEFAIIGNRLNAMADDIRLLMENERKNEKVKNDLITNVAHDLRTPLTSIIGYLDLTIKQPQLEDLVRQKYIQVAYDKSLRLEKLIGDLFNYTKFNSDEIKLNMISLDIVKLMEQMVDEFYPAFQEAGLTCDFLADKDTIIVIGDGDMLARAFSNLIANAVKYGKDGKNIRIHIRQNEYDVVVSITNYGEVIPEKDIVHVFDRFYRVEGSRNVETGGTGLGLAIAKKAILLHGGKIHVTSTLEGTVFKITLKKEGKIHESKV